MRVRWCGGAVAWRDKRAMRVWWRGRRGGCGEVWRVIKKAPMCVSEPWGVWNKRVYMVLFFVFLGGFLLGEHAYEVLFVE